MVNEDNVVLGTPPEFPDIDYATRLSAVNKTLKFTNIRGKEYAEVNQRILAFWSLFPNGRIVTKITADTGTRVDVEACVYRSSMDYEPATVGHAFEMKTGAINGTSYVENCETSAIGRALGFLGIGANTAIASAEEVLNAISQQQQQQAQQTKKPAARKPKSQPKAEPQQQPTDELWERALGIVHRGGDGVKDSFMQQMREVFHVERFSQLDPDQRRSMSSWLDTVEAALQGNNE